MAINADRFAIERVSNLLNSFGWVVVGSSTGGPTLRLTIQRPKTTAGSQADKLMLTQIERILMPLAWSPIVTDISGDKIEAIIEHTKTPEPAKQRAPGGIGISHQEES